MYTFFPSAECAFRCSLIHFVFLNVLLHPFWLQSTRGGAAPPAGEGGWKRGRVFLESEYTKACDGRGSPYYDSERHMKGIPSHFMRSFRKKTRGGGVRVRREGGGGRA